jgi:8-oxo-dGTP pyrophosphatase MutT (NUDIX family)
MTFDNQKWESLTKESILVKKPWFEVFREEVRLPDGELVPEYYGIEMPHYTAVFAVTVEQKIIILRCYRHAVGKVTLTMPGGMIEESESPMAGIQREFLEETGYKAKDSGTQLAVAGLITFFSQPELTLCRNLIPETWKNWNYYCGHQKK